MNQASQGDYVAIFTPNSIEAPKYQRASIGRQLLNIEQTINGTTTTNETWWINEPMYVEENMLAGILAMSIWLGIFMWGFCWLNCIWLAPNIDNPFEDIAAKIAKNVKN